MFSATHSLKGLSCLNSPGTPQRHSADLRRQQNFAEKSVIAAISCVEQRSFKIPQLPALREVVSESAQQKRRFFLLLFLSSSAEPQNRPRSVQNSPEGLGACRVPNRSTQGLTTAHRPLLVTLRFVPYLFQQISCLHDASQWEVQAAAGCSSGCCSAANFRRGASACWLPPCGRIRVPPIA